MVAEQPEPWFRALITNNNNHQQTARFLLQTLCTRGLKHVSRGPHAARQFILYDQLPDLSSGAIGSRGFIFQEFLDCRGIYFITGLKDQKSLLPLNGDV
jgi:hypothetical protein